MSTTTTVTGNLTRDPEIRYTREGHASTLLGVAVNRRWENRETREWEESTSFFDVVCWRDLAENAALSLAKGMRVMVTGRLEQRSWETEDGERRSKVEIVADEIGPSLRFATAEVQRTERRAGGQAPVADAPAGNGGPDDEQDGPLADAPAGSPGGGGPGAAGEAVAAEA
jgi:single-strand DNA-binding protein